MAVRVESACPFTVPAGPGRTIGLELLHHARMEWAAETMHWLLDVHFGEDFCRAADKTIQKNLNILRKFALSIFKTFKQKTASKRLLSHIMFAGLLNPASLRALLFEN